jgi:tetratricopeptide (TPR) repeat protein
VIAHLQEHARGGAHSKAALERLGYAYIARARVGNDPGDYKLAQMVAECLDARHPGDPAALLLRGHVLHQLHRFGEAEHIGRQLVAKRTFVLDYGLLGDALMEQGRLPEAATAYQKMMDLKPFYQSYTRAAHMRWLKGDLNGAIEVIRLAIASASPRDPESSAWAWTRLAGYDLQAGRLSAAMQAADTALRYQPNYAAALFTRGRIFVAMPRLSDAVAALRQAARLNPLPEYQWMLADVLRLQGLGDRASAVEEDLVRRGGSTDPRTLALYLATRRADLPRATALAEEELRARADVFTLDAHAWTLAASGRIAEALRVITRAVAEGTQDGRLFLHAGVIHAAAGRDREAKRWLRKAAQLRATLLPSEVDVLTRHLKKQAPLTLAQMPARCRRQLAAGTRQRSPVCRGAEVSLPAAYGLLPTTQSECRNSPLSSGRGNHTNEEN